MSDQYEQSRAAFEALYQHPNTYDASQNVRDHIKQTNEIAWEAWCRALDYAASRECVYTPITTDYASRQIVGAGCDGRWVRTGDRKPFNYCPGCGGRVKIQEQQTNEEQ